MLTIASRVVLLALACSVAAQVDTPEQRLAATRAELERNVIAQLQSADVATVAWGAYAAAELRLTGCIPELRKSLAKNAGPHPVAHALLDALIQTDAVVPGEELEPLLSLRAPTIVLLSRQPDANRALLLRLFRGAGAARAWIDGERLACGHLLANLRDGGFVRELLREPLELWVYVVDPGAKSNAEILKGGGLISCGRFPVPKGYPPIARHQLSSGGRSGDRLVVPGPEPVFLHRSTFHDGLHCSFSDGYFAVHEARAGWLEQLLGAERRDMILAIDRPVAMEWKDLAALDTHATQARRQAEGRWRALVTACIAAKLLDVDPATEPPPKVTVEYIDERTDQTVPLPRNPDWWK